jgi:hypothetical protein
VGTPQPPDTPVRPSLAVPTQRSASEPKSDVDGPAPAGTPKRGRNWRLIFAVLAGVLGLLCVGGIGVGYAIYDRATQLDRSQPDLVVSSYLRALLVTRDDVQASLYACEGRSQLESIQGMREEIERREHELGVSITVSWGELQIDERSPDRTVISTDVRRSAIVDGVSQSVADRWRFTIVNEHGWRVCGAERPAQAIRPRGDAPAPPESSGTGRSTPSGTTPVPA